MRILVKLTFVLCFISFPLFAASFNCTKASQTVDKIICQDPSLNLKDSYMGLLYLSISGDSSNIKQKLMHSQKQWLDERNRCTTAPCITKAYDQRIAELKQYHPSISKVNNAPLKGKWLNSYSNQFASSTLEITEMGKNGFAYQIDAKNGANTGAIKAQAVFIDNDAISIDKTQLTDQAETPCLILFQSINNNLVITDNDACNSYFGNGVSFEGTYVKDGKTHVLNLQEQGLLDTKQQELEFKKMTGKDYELFVTGCGGSTSETEESQAPKANVHTAFMRGLANSSACIIMSDNNKLWAAVIDDELEQIKYYTNDQGYFRTVPLSIDKWIKELEAAQGKKLKVVYVNSQ